MAERTRVVVYGSSLQMAGLAASLKAEAGLEVVSVAPASPTIRQRLNKLHPAVMVFDLSDSSLDLYITLREQPDLLLLGVDPANDEVLVLSSRSAQALSVADLLDIIRRKESPSKTLR